MEINISTKQILKILYVVAWVVFIGVCTEAGGFIVNMVVAMVVEPGGANKFWQEVNLSALFQYDHGYFLVQTLLMSMVAVMRAILFYLIVKILHDKKLNMSQPFNKAVGRFIFNVSYLTFGIGLFSLWGANYAEWLVKQGVAMPEIQHMRLAGADVWLFMSITLYVIAQIFKRGIEIQEENELTI